MLLIYDGKNHLINKYSRLGIVDYNKNHLINKYSRLGMQTIFINHSKLVSYAYEP